MRDCTKQTVSIFSARRLAAASAYKLWQKTSNNKRFPREFIEAHEFMERHFVDKLTLEDPRTGLPIRYWYKLDYQERVNVILDLHSSLRWAELGMPTFNLTEDLAANLLLTDCSALYGCDIILPFEAFAIKVPSGLISYLGYDDEEVPIDHVVVHRYSTSDGDQVFMAAQAASGHPPLFRVSDMFKDDEKIKSFIQAAERAEGNLCEDGLSYEEKDKEAMGSIARLIVNLAVYISGMKERGEWADNPVDPKVAKSRRKKGKKPLPKEWRLGGSIKLDPNLRMAARSSSQRSAEWRMIARHMVRGHYKRQAYGPQRELRKVVKIEPYWRGPDSPVMERNYNVR